MMRYIAVKLIKHAFVYTMNTRLNTCILTVFSLTYRDNASPRLIQLFFCIQSICPCGRNGPPLA